MALSLSITALYASLLGLLLLVLSFNIIRLRFSLKVGLGDGGHKSLVKAVRIHGNFIEYIPFALILLGCYELNGGQSFWLHVLGSTLFIGRVLHAVGLTKSIGTSSQRIFGMISTFVVLLVLIIENIRLYIF